MTTLTNRITQLFKTASSFLAERSSSFISAGAVLSFLCLATAVVMTWTLLESSNQTQSGHPLTTFALTSERSGATPDEIYARLLQSAISNESQATDSKKASWVLVDLSGSSNLKGQIVEFDVLRFEGARFWLVSNIAGTTAFKPVPNLAGKSGLSSKGGFSIEIPPGENTVGVLGEFHTYMPGAIKSQIWEWHEYAASERNYERKGGALFGSLLILAAFSAIVALVNRDLTFLLFSGWSVTSLRIAAVNAGWDRVWLGLEIDNDTYLAVLRVLIAAYGYFAAALFRELIQKDGDKSPRVILQSSLEKGFILFAVISPFISHIAFLRYFWAYAAVALGILTLQVAYFVAMHRSRLSILYALSWGCMIVGMASEISAKSGISSYPLWLNSQTASVVSALIMGLALADRLRTERDGRMAAQARSLRYLKKYEENFNSVPVGLFMINADGTLRLRNPAFDAIFGIDDEYLESRPHFDGFTHPGFFEQLRTAANQGLPDVEIESYDHHSATRWFLARVRCHDGAVEGSIQDITSRKAAENQLKHLVDHDYLTGLQNRRSLEDTINRALHAVRNQVACAVACVDIDRFKLINDLHGHAAGDSLLWQSGERLRNAVRSTDAIARVADSFFVVFFDCAAPTVATLAERIRVAFNERPFEFDGKGLNVTASVGVVSLETGMTGVDAMAAADRACIEAKARGRNCVVQFSEGDDDMRRHLEELRVVADLQRRVPTERYFLEFQPIVALQPGLGDMNYEVLIRMRDEGGRVIPPGKFIGAAERNGLMAQIDRWVLRTTMEWLDSHPQHLETVGFVTLNISGASLNDTRFVEDAFALMTEFPRVVSKLCFEITESVALNDMSSTRMFVEKVRMFGAKVALDDFGAGYTSFNYLREIPADFIKIDGSFIRDINRNPANYAITRMIVDLTHELGMQCIAEWAETRDTVASLMELGVDYGQGFGLVRPTAPELLSTAQTSRDLMRDPDIVSLLQEGRQKLVALPGGMAQVAGNPG